MDGAPSVQVRLCSSAAKVPLSPEEGIGALKSRVAGAFGLTAPFDILGPEGRLTTDEDAAQALKGEGSELSISTGEDALLDLERAREESGVLRWALLRQILADMRARMAEMSSNISEGKHKAAVLEQQLVRERSSREAIQNALRNELVESKEQLAVEIHKVRQESKRNLDEAVSGLQQQVQILAKEHSDALESKEAALKEALQSESAGRLRDADENLRRFQELRNLVTEESTARGDAFEKALSAVNATEQRLSAESSARRELQAQTEAAIGKRSNEIQQLETKLSAFISSMQSSLADSNAKLEAEESLRASGLEKLGNSMEALRQEVGSRVAQLEGNINEAMAGLEADLKAMVMEVKEKAQQQDQQQKDALQELSRKLEEEASDRRQCEQRTAGMLSGLQVAISNEEQAREAALTEASRLQGLLEARLETLESGLKDTAVGLKAEISNLEESFSKFCAEEQVARDVAKQDLEAAQLRKHEALSEEMRRAHAAQTEESRQWAQTLVERLSNDLRGEREALFQELNRRCDEVAKLNAEHIRLEMAAELQKVDATSSEMLLKQKAMLEEEKHRYEHQASCAASEVKAALDAHGDFAEALEAEQRLIVEHLTEQLTKEAAQRHELMKRLGVVEMDVQKVRGHLPILFASPTAFR